MRKLREALQEQVTFTFLTPAILWQLLFLYVPLLVLFVYSISSVVDGHFIFTLSHYKALLQPFSLKIFGNSFFLAFETTLICLAIAFPVAYYLVFRIKCLRTFFLMLIILPSWTSLIIQIYAWFFLLKKDGWINHMLSTFGLISTPEHMLNSHFAMLIGMVYCYLPFMVLPIYAVLEKIDYRMIEASADLGASRWETIWKVVLPLSRSGVIAGLFLVFIPAFGEFAIPEFLGGSKKLFWGNVIVSKFLDYRDWHSGAAVTYSGLVFTALMMLFFYLVFTFGRRILLRSGRS